MNIITAKYRTFQIEVPDQLLITESSYLHGMIVGTHYHLKVGVQYKDTNLQIFDVIAKNGINIEPDEMYLMPTDFERVKYVPCTVEQFLKMKAFM